MSKKSDSAFTEQDVGSLQAHADETVEHERLVAQLREANENLVVASLHAHAIADDAIAARAVADSSVQRLELLLFASSSFVWRATSAGRVDLDHAAWHELTGLRASDDEWGWLDAIHPTDQSRVRVAWIDAIAATTPYACQHRILSRKGGFTWVMSRAVPIVKSGIVCEWIGSMIDVSDRVRVEEAHDQFIGILGHELRNPLTSIVGGLDQLRDLPAPFARIVARLTRSTDRIEVLVRDLLDFARGRLGGGIPIAPRPCDMDVICREVVEESKQAHAGRAIHYKGDDDLTGEWDPYRIAQVMSNLVRNAVVHGLDPIVVTSRAADDRVITEVHNRGTPIPAALVPTLFEPFTRGVYVVDDGQAGGVGVGLGLYIASDIVHAHGGTLSVASSVVEGTSFSFSLPRIRQ